MAYLDTQVENKYVTYYKQSLLDVIKGYPRVTNFAKLLESDRLENNETKS